MKTIPATEMKQRFGACVDAALAGPVLVERSGRPAVVVLSVAEFERLTALEKQLEDMQWGILAQKAAEGGFLNDEESSQWLNEMKERLNAGA